MFSPGAILDRRYQLIHCLGRSPARQTWLAQDQQAQDRVVVKLLSFSGAIEWQDLKLFEREAQVLHQLDHPNIPSYRDHFSNSDTPAWFAIVHTYIPGRSLKDLIDQGRRFRERELRQIATQVLEILVYLHGQTPRILHRDIKPSNLIWGEDDRIYVVDFGAVQARAATQDQTFTVVGTYGYTPLEQYGGRAVPASDLYALGATLIHLATGRAPADLPQKQMRLHFRDQVSLDPSWIRWLEQITEPNVDRRFPSARQALAQLQSDPQRSLSFLSSDKPSPRSDLPIAEQTPEVLRITIPGLPLKPSGLAQVALNPILWIYAGLLTGTLVFGVRPLMGFWALLAAPLMFVSYFSLTKFLTVTVIITSLDLQMIYQLGDRVLLSRRIAVGEIEAILAVPQSEIDETCRCKLMVRTPRGRYALGARSWEREQIQPLQHQIATWMGKPMEPPIPDSDPSTHPSTSPDRAHSSQGLHRGNPME